MYYYYVFNLNLPNISWIFSFIVKKVNFFYYIQLTLKVKKNHYHNHCYIILKMKNSI